MNTLTSSQILAGIRDSNPAAFFPTKKLDSKETVLGQLSDELQRIWAYKAELEAPIVEAVAKFGDLLAAYKADLTLHGELPADKVTEYQGKFDAATDGVTKLGVTYVIVHKLFNSLVRADFGEAANVAEKKVLGIREGFQVVAREQDTRQDGRCPLCDFQDSYAEFRGLTQTESTIQVKFYFAVPTGTTADDHSTEEHPAAEEPAPAAPAAASDSQA